MSIARVIVDVPSSSINQTFDYLIPDRFKNILQKGMRVVIPFGPRKITGFVVDRVEKSDVQSLKEIIDVLDMTPVLTDELLELGKWLADQTVSLYITVYQAMLPHVLKAKYYKVLEKSDEESELPPELEKLFADESRIPFDNLSELSVPYDMLQKAIQMGDIRVHYAVQTRETKKYKKMIRPSVSSNLLKDHVDVLPANAIRQQQILNHFIDHPEPVEQSQLMKSLQVTRAPIKALLDKGLLKEKNIEVYRNPYQHRSFERTSPLPLTEEQAQAIRPIKEAFKNRMHRVFLLHGVTGSGKTEIYLQAIDDVIRAGKEAIVLVPEISLTPQMVQRFKGRFGSEVAVFHSALSAGEKYDEWRKIHRQEVKVVVGARSAIFAPFKNIGMIIIDEEHETTYKQEDQPRYHARDVAIYRAKKHQCPVVLGSATPSLESYARAKKSVYQLLTLTKRTNEQSMPTVHVVDMREELRSGNRTMFSLSLQEKIRERLALKEQIVLLLNRRGYASFVMCRDCGHVPECPDCDISLTYHKTGQRLKCHYCDFEEPIPHQCPKCQSVHIRYFGTGTERVQEALLDIIPEARIIRMDVDTTRRKGSHEKYLQQFANYEADILLGTQMIAKGLDFPNVTLVGVLTADSILHLPDLRAAEKTFQLLTQVSGRAGRHELPGEVVIQSYTPEHYSIQHASHYHYEQFFAEEMRMRRTFKYPPYVFLALITVSHERQDVAHQMTQYIVQTLMRHVQPDTVVLGPTPSPLMRIKDRYRYQCMVKYRNEPQLTHLIRKILRLIDDKMRKEDIQVSVDMEPYQFM